MTKKKIPKWIWFIPFGFVLLLTQSNIWINYNASPGILGFPDWLWWFMAFHAVFIIVLYLFVENYEER